jgi:hypothetical protein
MLCSSLIWLSSPRLGGHLLARDASLYCPGRVVVCTNLPSFLIQSVQSTILKKKSTFTSSFRAMHRGP